MNGETKTPEIQPFAVKDCALIAIATGVQAYNLRELRDKLTNIHPGRYLLSLLGQSFVSPF